MVLLKSAHLPIGFVSYDKNIIQRVLS